MNNIIIITSYRPDYQLINLYDKLIELNFNNIIICDDGSGPEFEEIYANLSEKGAHIIHHHENLGKGIAIKDALTYILKTFPDANGVVIADGDGQHLALDIKRISDVLSLSKNEIIVGMRDLKSKNVPLNIKLRNRFSSAVYRINTGKKISDSQTGLRGIPHGLIPFAASVDGNRFEYETNLLNEASIKEIPLKRIEIETVFPEKNKTYYRPFFDTAMFLKSPIRFFTFSFSCSIADILLFALFSHILEHRTANNIFTATILARIISGSVNFILNKKWSFKDHGKIKKQLIKFFSFFTFQMLLSSTFVSLFSFIHLPLIIIKMFVDTALSVLNYIVQKRWIFK